jgi:hypothetical protein
MPLLHLPHLWQLIFALPSRTTIASDPVRHLPPPLCVLFVRVEGVLRTCLHNLLVLISSPLLTLFSLVFLKNDAALGNLPLPVQPKSVNLAPLLPLLQTESLPSSLLPALRPLLVAEPLSSLTPPFLRGLLLEPLNQIDFALRLLLLRLLRLLLPLSTA